MRHCLIVLAILAALSAVAANVWAEAFQPGDANGDNSITQADLDIVLSNYNKTGMTWGEGDFNGDGSVNCVDLNAYYSNTGIASATGAAPEPSSLVLLGVGAVGLLAWRWRRGRAT
jgi:hypothetical protein